MLKPNYDSKILIIYVLPVLLVGVRVAFYAIL